MARHGRTQAELAAALGTSQTAVSRRLTGAVPFDINELTAIAAFIGVPLAELIGTADVEALISPERRAG